MNPFKHKWFWIILIILLAAWFVFMLTYHQHHGIGHGGY